MRIQFLCFVLERCVVSNDAGRANQWVIDSVEIIIEGCLNIDNKDWMPRTLILILNQLNTKYKNVKKNVKRIIHNIIF